LVEVSKEEKNSQAHRPTNHTIFFLEVSENFTDKKNPRSIHSFQADISLPLTA